MKTKPSDEIPSPESSRPKSPRISREKKLKSKLEEKEDPKLSDLSELKSLQTEATIPEEPIQEKPEVKESEKLIIETPKPQIENQIVEATVEVNKEKQIEHKEQVEVQIESKPKNKASHSAGKLERKSEVKESQTDSQIELKPKTQIESKVLDVKVEAKSDVKNVEAPSKDKKIISSDSSDSKSKIKSSKTPRDKDTPRVRKGHDDKEAQNEVTTPKSKTRSGPKKTSEPKASTPKGKKSDSEKPKLKKRNSCSEQLPSEDLIDFLMRQQDLEKVTQSPATEVVLPSDPIPTFEEARPATPGKKEFDFLVS